MKKLFQKMLKWVLWHSPYAIQDFAVECWLKYSGYLRDENRFWEVIKQTKAFRELNASSVYVDCGVNFGSVANAFIKKGVTAYLFEPLLQCFSFLQRKFGSNAKVHLYNKAVGDRAGKMPFYTPPQENGDVSLWKLECASFDRLRDNALNTMMEVDVIDFCDFLEKLNTPVDFLKMDIEGAEYPILEKMIATGVYKKIHHCFVFAHADCVNNGLFDEADARVRELITQHQISNIYLLYMDHVFPAWPVDWKLKGGYDNLSAAS